MNTLVKNNWVKLLKMYYQIDISVQFLNCADLQLSEQFVKATGINLDEKIRLAWEQKEKPEVILEEISIMPAVIWLKYGMVNIKIAWSSKSGKIYEINCSDIDCNDIQFWFEDLDVEKCKKYHKPDFSKFFPFYETFTSYAQETYHISMSNAYVMCMREHLSKDFEFKTGLKINKDIDLQYEKYSFFYTKGEISRTQATIYINHNWNSKAQICWKSKSGRIYEMTDGDIDCNDITMWFEGLEPDLYYRQLYPKDQLPFKLKDLTYKLKINRIQTDCEMLLTLKKEEVINAEIFLNGIYNFINEYNIASEQKDRKTGVVHNASGGTNGNKITLNIDIGSAGAVFFKKLFNYFSMLGAFEEVEVD
jgi:hypothetical protein